jgi:signal transduction histidine kinase
MTMVDTDQLVETVQGLREASQSALAHESAEDFEAFERYLNEVEAFVRETQQSLWSNEARATIRRLEKGDPLNEPDMELIRAFLISDAQRYLAHENNYNDWLKELRRLVDDLCKRVNTVGRETIADLRGVLKDAIRLVPDIRNYLDEKRRVEKFEQALETLDKSSRDMLVRVLREQLRAHNR